MLRGENFRLKDKQGNSENLGFYTTKIVTASSFDEAELKAIDLVRQDKRLTPYNSSSNLEPVIFLEFISLASLWNINSGSGYTFWPMNPLENE